MKSAIGTFALHLGWALWGQECDCEHRPHFNKLARLMQRITYMDDELEFHDRFSALAWRAGQRLVDLGTRWED